MATVTPSIDTAIVGVPRLIWEEAATGDTLTPYAITSQYGLSASVQAVGTFGGATVILQVSNDGANWATARDVLGDLISFTTASYSEFTTSAAYIRPAVTGGTGDDVDVILTLRGCNSV